MCPCSLQPDLHTLLGLWHLRHQPTDTPPVSSIKHGMGRGLSNHARSMHPNGTTDSWGCCLVPCRHHPATHHSFDTRLTAQVLLHCPPPTGVVVGVLLQLWGPCVLCCAALCWVAGSTYLGEVSASGGNSDVISMLVASGCCQACITCPVVILWAFALLAPRA